MQVTGPHRLSKEELVSRVLQAPRVRSAIAAAAAAAPPPHADADAYETLARHVALRASVDLRLSLLSLLHRILRWLLPYLVWGFVAACSERVCARVCAFLCVLLLLASMYVCVRVRLRVRTHTHTRTHAHTQVQDVYVDAAGLRAVQRAALEHGCPIVYVPVAHSALQGILLPIVCRALDMAVPALASPRRLARLVQGPWRSSFLARLSGCSAPLSGLETGIARQVTREYLTLLLMQGYNIDLATEAEDGSLSPPRLSLLSVFVEAVTSGRLENVIVAPVALQHDGAVQGSDYSQPLRSSRLRNYTVTGASLSPGHGSSSSSPGWSSPARNPSRQSTPPASPKRAGKGGTPTGTPVRTPVRGGGSAGQHQAGAGAGAGAAEPVDEKLPQLDRFGSPVGELLALWDRSRPWFNVGTGTLIVKVGEPIVLRQAVQAAGRGRGGGGAGDGDGGVGGAEEGLADVARVVAVVAHRVVDELNRQTVVVPATLVATVLLTQSGRGISLSDLVDRVQWLQGEVMCRGGLVAPITDAARAVGSTLRLLESHVVFPHKGETLEPLLRPRDALESQRVLAALRNQCVHLFVHEALALCALVSLPSESKGKAHWVRMAAVRGDALLLADVLKLHFTFPASTFEDAVEMLSLRGAVSILYDDGYGQRLQLNSSAQALRLVKLLRGMIVPLLDAYWVAALSLLPLQAPGGAGGDDVSLKSHVVRMQRIANTMYLENKVHSTEAAAEAALLKAVSRLELAHLVQRCVLPDHQVLVRVLSQAQRPAKLEKDSRAADEPLLFESKGLSLLDAIRTLDAKRRLAPSCAPLLADAPGIVSVS